MPWPLSQDYNEAIQNPATCFADAELKQGEAVCNALGLPQPCSGNFADVYAVQHGARKWAVKCFTRQIPGLQERYVHISKYLQEVKLPFMVEFSFLEKGIQVRGQWYPVLKMQWVEGFALNTFVRDNLDKPQVLQTLSVIWLRLAQALREANLAHCDLQHGNVLLVPGSKAGSVGVKLVDYDGMCVPALELLKSIELGHANFQHPQRLKEGTYGLQIDRFPHLAIYTALRALSVGGKALWDRFDNGDNLLFTQKDFAAPTKSPVFQELLKSSDAEVKKLTQALAQAAQKPIEQVPLLDELVETKPVTKTQAAAPAAATKPAAPSAGNVFAAATGAGPTGRRTKYEAKKQSVAGVAIAAGIGALVLIGGITAFLLTRGSPTSKAEVVAEVHKAQASRAVNVERPTSAARSETKPVTRLQTKIEKTEPKKEPKDEPKTQLKEITNSLGMKLMMIPPGKFTMGSPADEPGHAADQMEHEVVITQPVYMGAYEVTVGQFRAFIKASPTYKIDNAWENPADKHPVVQVTRFDAAAFCDWLTKKERRKYRLPTEAEWEYACRAGTKTACYFGNEAATSYVWHTPNSGGGTHPVGELKPNPWGLYDMLGNAWEWTADWYDADYFKKSPKEDPSGPRTGTTGVMRGGGWRADKNECRAAHRVGAHPPANRFNDVGFRVVADGTEPVTEPKTEPKLEVVGEIRELTGGVGEFAPNNHDFVYSDGKTLHLCEIVSGKELTQFDGHTDKITSLSFSSNGKRLLTGSADKTVRLWDVESGKELQRFSGHAEAVGALGWAAAGRRVLAAGLDKTIRVWDADTGKELRNFSFFTGNNEVYVRAFTANGRHALSSGIENTVRWWDVDSGKPITSFDGKSHGYGATISRDGRYLVTCGDVYARLWDVNGFREMRLFKGHTAHVYVVALSGDAKRLVTSGWDGSVRLYDTSTGKENRAFTAHTDPVYQIALSRDGRYALSAGSNKVRLWGLPK